MIRPAHGARGFREDAPEIGASVARGTWANPRTASARELLDSRRMKSRRAAQLWFTCLAAVTAAIATGCLSSSFEIPVLEIRNANSGVVHEHDGTKQELRPTDEVRPKPHDGARLAQVGELKEGVPGVPILIPKPADEITTKKIVPHALSGPITAVPVGPYLVLQSDTADIAVLPETLRGLEVTRPSPGRTAALWGGIAGGSAVAVTFVLVLISVANINLMTR